MRNVEAEHAEHVEHIKAEHDGHLPDIPQYEYMNRRLKPYPWGMNSLFFNPHVSRSTVLVFVSTNHLQVNKDLSEE